MHCSKFGPFSTRQLFYVSAAPVVNCANRRSEIVHSIFKYLNFKVSFYSSALCFFFCSMHLICVESWARRHLFLHMRLRPPYVFIMTWLCAFVTEWVQVSNSLHLVHYLNSSNSHYGAREVLACLLLTFSSSSSSEMLWSFSPVNHLSFWVIITVPL